ncbi:MAG: CO dehydrogenase maturation factor [bacterium]|nr:MAG: CO dehydrogenase maturation factor [bacterium]
MLRPRSDRRNAGRVLAVSGKGGAGKTALVAIMVGVLSKRERFKILAIDADSAACLPSALGATVDRTVGDIREEIIRNPEAKNRIEDIPMQEVVADVMGRGNGFELLVMGRPEGPGCFCAVNDLLRYGIETLSKDFDITLIDCEAGPEQINRRVLRSVDTLVIVTDTSTRGIHNAMLIKKITEENKDTSETKMGLVINRVKEESKGIIEIAEQTGLKILGYIPEDENITRFDSVGKPIIDLPHDSPGVVAVREVLHQIGF